MQSRESLEILRGTRDLLSDPQHWTQGTYARRADGASVLPSGEEAAQWCLVGASRKVATMVCGNNGMMAYDYADRAFAPAYEMGSVTEFNDNHTHAEVMAYLDTFIAERELEEFMASLKGEQGMPEPDPQPEPAPQVERELVLV